MLNWIGSQIGTAIFGANEEKKIKLPSGQFYLLDPTNLKANRVLKFKDSSSEIVLFIFEFMPHPSYTILTG
jgi:hypothetical protein